MRPNICYIVNTSSQFMCEPRNFHLIAAKHILRYVRGTLKYGLKFSCTNDLQLHGLFDLDWVGCIIDRKSTTSFYFSLGSDMISWCSMKQKCVAQSTSEVEYVVACTAA